MQVPEKFYKSQDLWWSINDFGEISIKDIDGPYCGSCFFDLAFPVELYEDSNLQRYADRYIKWTGKMECPNCEVKQEVKIPINDLKRKVYFQYIAKQRAGVPKESLDDLPTQVKVRDEDDKYFLATKIGEKDGKRVGVVYFGEKTKEQKKSDYAQIFVDLDDEQIRFDKSNKHPKEILAKMTIEFPDSISTSEFKKK